MEVLLWFNYESMTSAVEGPLGCLVVFIFRALLLMSFLPSWFEFLILQQWKFCGLHIHDLCFLEFCCIISLKTSCHLVFPLYSPPPPWHCSPTRAMTSSFLMRFLDHTQRRTTFGRTPLDEWSARRRDLYLTTHNTHNRQTSMPPAGFEPTISAGERPQTYALDGAATGTDTISRSFW